MRMMNDKANVQMIGAVVGILITLIIAVLVFYNVAGSIDTDGIDANFGGTNETPAANATDDTMDQSATFFSIAPINSQESDEDSQELGDRCCCSCCCDLRLR